MPITDAPVLVTGATGFAAAEIVKQLLEAGYRVRGTTRDVDKVRGEGDLTSLDGAAARLELFDADLNEPGVYTPHMAGCEYVIHTASPYRLTVDDPQGDLVDPAVNGTLSVLASAAATPGMRRVVLTSSFAAINDGPRTEPYDESHWNTTSSLTHRPYDYSKTMAERAAWDFMGAGDRHFDLVVINPTAVIGPSAVGRVNETHKMMTGLTNGRTPVIIDLGFPSVDVRDVARAHIRAMETPSAGGRYLVSAGTPSTRRYVEIMREAGYGERYRLPKLGLDNPIGNILVRAFAFAQPKGVREFVITNLGRTLTLNTSKAETDLGMRWSSLDDAIRDQARFLDEKGHLGKK